MDESRKAELAKQRAAAAEQHAGARAALEKREKALQAEADRVESASRELEAVGAQIAASDPDHDAAKFSELVAKRATSSGRLEALRERQADAERLREQASDEVGSASEALRATDLELLEIEIARLDRLAGEQTAAYHEACGRTVTDLCAAEARAHSLGGGGPSRSRWSECRPGLPVPVLFEKLGRALLAYRNAQKLKASAAEGPPAPVAEETSVAEAGQDGE